MQIAIKTGAICLCILFVAITGCTVISDPIEGCWYTSIMGAQMYLQFNPGGSAYMSSSFGTGATVWEKVGPNHYVLYTTEDKSKKYDIYYNDQSQSLTVDTNQKMMFSNQDMRIQFIKTKCTG